MFANNLITVLYYFNLCIKHSRSLLPNNAIYICTCCKDAQMLRRRTTCKYLSFASLLVLRLAQICYDITYATIDMQDKANAAQCLLN